MLRNLTLQGTRIYGQCTDRHVPRLIARVTRSAARSNGVVVASYWRHLTNCSSTYCWSGPRPWSDARAPAHDALYPNAPSIVSNCSTAATGDIKHMSQRGVVTPLKGSGALYLGGQNNPESTTEACLIIGLWFWHLKPPFNVFKYFYSANSIKCSHSDIQSLVSASNIDRRNSE